MAKINFIKRSKLPLEELEEYYRNRRLERFEGGNSVNGLLVRRILHVPIIMVLKLWHHICSTKLRVIYNNSSKRKRPTIYAATHICWDDIEYILDAITNHAYLFWGDPGNLYRTFAGALLDINGCVICDTEYKRDRFIAKETAIKVLGAGENLLIFPEGVWNTSENKLVNYFFPGIAEMAIRTKADIVPVAIEHSEKGFDVAIGKQIITESFTSKDKQKLLQDVRDAMATLKWDVLEVSGIHRRSDIPYNYSKIFQSKIIEDARGIVDWKGFKEQEFHHRDITEPNEAFAFMDSLIPRRENAFLFRQE